MTHTPLVTYEFSECCILASRGEHICHCAPDSAHKRDIPTFSYPPQAPSGSQTRRQPAPPLSCHTTRASRGLPQTAAWHQDVIVRKRRTDRRGAHSTPQRHDAAPVVPHRFLQLRMPIERRRVRVDDNTRLARRRRALLRRCRRRRCRTRRHAIHAVAVTIVPLRARAELRVFVDRLVHRRARHAVLRVGVPASMARATRARTDPRAVCASSTWGSSHAPGRC